MSGKATGRVWELELHHAERLVLLALADHADHLGANIYPSIGLVAWKTGYSESQVRRIMRQLVNSRYLIVVRNGGGRGNPNVYRFDLDAGLVKAPFVGGGGSDGGSDGTMTPIPVKPIRMTPIIGNGRMMTPISDDTPVSMTPIPCIPSNVTPFPDEKPSTMTPILDNPSTVTPFTDNPSTLTPIDRMEKVSFDELKGVIPALKGVIAMTPEGTEGTLRNGDDARAHTHTREGPPPPLFEKRDTGETEDDAGDRDDGHDPYESLLEIDFVPIQATWALAAYQAASIPLDVAEVARIAAYVCENPLGKNNPAAYLASQWKRGKVAPLVRPSVARRGPAWDNETNRFEPQPATIPDDQREVARRMREESERRAVIPDEIVGLGGLAQALRGPVLRRMPAPAPLQFPGNPRP